MLVRDDEDLAVDQLRNDASPARANDHRLHNALSPGTVAQEHAAERAERPPVAGVASRLRQLSGERESLRAQLAMLPVEQLRRLESAEQQRAQTAEQRALAAAALTVLPTPHRRFGRNTDPHAVERARLAEAIQSADAHLASLDRQQTQLYASIGPVDQLRAERDGLRRRADEVDAVRERLLDQSARTGSVDIQCG